MRKINHEIFTIFSRFVYNFNKYFNFNGNILYDGIIINNVPKLEYWIFYTLTFYLYPVIIFKKTRIILYWNSKNRYFINKKNCSLRVSDKKKNWFRRYKLIIEWKYTKILIICNANNLESSKNSYINFFYREIGHK